MEYLTLLYNVIILKEEGLLILMELQAKAKMRVYI